MTPRTFAHSLAALALVLAAACGGGGSSNSPAAQATPTPTPTPAPVVKTATATVAGQSMTILVDAEKGLTLYRWTNDKAGTSNCTAACLAVWPALEVTDSSTTPTGGTGVTGKLGVATDASGKPQVTYNSWPLYFYAKDKNPGDATGQGVGGKWFVVTPDQAPPSS